MFREYTRIERAERGTLARFARPVSGRVHSDVWVTLPSELYTHFTAVNDPEFTKDIIYNSMGLFVPISYDYDLIRNTFMLVRNTILRKSLQSSSLL